MLTDKIKIESSIKLEQCEKFIEQIGSGDYPLLELPPRLTGFGALGLEASLVHLIIAWARTSKNSTLVLPVSPEKVSTFLSDLCTTVYGFVALACAKSVNDKSGSLIPPQDIKKLVTARLKEFDNTDTPRMFAQDEGISFISVYGGQYEHGRWMFTAPSITKPPKLQSPQQLVRLIGRCIEQIIPNKFLDRFDKERLNNLGLVAFELLENAYQHGRLDEFADPIKIGVRGISIRVIEIDIDSSDIVAGGNKGVSLYLIRRALKDKGKENLFFEMTVFDSGIGYRRWINARCNENHDTREYRDKSELETIQDCLLHHATSKTIAGSGIGLVRVIRLLKSMFGFVRIRTGQSCYYARLDMTLDGRPILLRGNYDEINNPDIKLEEWFPNRPLGESSGTSVTFCIPLTNWMKADNND
ncbi:MAG: hypothetical protein DID92_2727743620 [Candidatus Nitrotoga sp. SPKER]|nr:MAG: hypothetical protein DID92_2727743620 [Candidatus Nitrotoga sp. SPKER]